MSFSIVNLNLDFVPFRQCPGPSRKDKLWGGYVIECVDGAFYVGISCQFRRRFYEHWHNGTVDQAEEKYFIWSHGGPRRVVELYICDSEREARDWETVRTTELFLEWFPVKQVGGGPNLMCNWMHPHLLKSDKRTRKHLWSRLRRTDFRHTKEHDRYAEQQNEKRFTQWVARVGVPYDEI